MITQYMYRKLYISIFRLFHSVKFTNITFNNKDPVEVRYKANICFPHH